MYYYDSWVQEKILGDFRNSKIIIIFKKGYKADLYQLQNNPTFVIY